PCRRRSLVGGNASFIGEAPGGRPSPRKESTVPVRRQGLGSATEFSARSGTGCVMGWVRSQARCGLRYCVFGLVTLAAGLFITSDAADARHHRRIYVHYGRHVAHVQQRSRHAEEYAPPFSSLVIDGNSGEVLQASNADAIRHPASLTKIMTLYLLF